MKKQILGEVVARDDGVPHPRSYGAFARKIRKYVVDDGGDRSRQRRPEHDRHAGRSGAVPDPTVAPTARVRL
ncbi:MAG: hypothetical protein R6U63_05055 [Longimicrobiales bacterium]